MASAIHPFFLIKYPFVNTLVQKWNARIDEAKYLSDLKLFIEAYNKYQENEKDCVDYIFDLFNQDDLACCVKGGLTANEISEMVCNFESSPLHSQYFFFGCNHEQASQLSEDDITSQLKGFAEEIIVNMLIFPHCYNNVFYNMIIGSMVRELYCSPKI